METVRSGFECGCNAPYFGPPITETCGGGAFLIFMGILDTFLRNRCDISEICQRVKPRNEPDDFYDFIVIGSGSGGSTAAGRLMDSGRTWKVLLLEAGPDEPVGLQVPSLLGNYWQHPDIDWGYKTQPEQHAFFGHKDQRAPWYRGKLMGGCSTINGMMYMRGVRKDYDNWAALGNTGWSYDSVLPFFKRQEDNAEIGTRGINRKYHGTGGPLTVARFPDHPALGDDIMTAAEELGYPVSQDLNGDQFSGFTIAQTNNRHGTRLSSARAFVRPHRYNPKLHVMINTTVTKILTDFRNGKKVVSGVEMIYKNRKYMTSAKKEIILSAGAINSPQLLLISGIGPQEHLESLGISSFHHLPGVGQNLHNHVAFSLKFKVNKEKDDNVLDWAAAMNYILYRKGPMSSTGMSQVTARINTKYADPSGKHPDLQIFFGGYDAGCSDTGEIGRCANDLDPDRPRMININPVVLHPKSRGNLTLNSIDPLQYPMIYGNYLVEPEDVATLVEGVRIIQRLVNTTVLQEKYGIELEKDMYGECATMHGFDTDEFWHCGVKHMTDPENHQVGSCKMGPKSDPLAVVSPELLVHGIDNLRVIDASVIPVIVSGNTAATTMMIAERGVQFIRDKYKDFSNDRRPPFPPPGFGPPPPGHGHSPKKPEAGFAVFPPPPSFQNRVGVGHTAGSGGFQHTPDFHRRHPEIPNPFKQEEEEP